MSTKISLSDCTNESFFQLNEDIAKQLSADIQTFLKSKTYPWELLGSPLTEFVQKQVGKVAQSERLKGRISPQAFLENKETIVIEEGAVVEAGAFVCGPAYIEAGATVRHGAYIRGHVYVCKDAVVGHTSELKSALLLNSAKAAHFAYVGDSLLGIDCNLGAGTKCANLRLDHGQVPLRIGETVVSSGLKKFGAVFGNRAQTGCNAVTNPGTLLLPHAILLPNSTGQGVVAARKAFKPRESNP
ncbi:MAG: UDP-N-acetylglucosamine diphosphorylase [Proteobacteria bacterium]|nr:UDP-N-acetylglucosamine diphosphorylase [Pseudomonadota bacterium]